MSLEKMDERIDTDKELVPIVLSEFFLDTDLSDHALANIARSIRESGCSVENAENILRNELFPALYFNLRGVAGESEGFSKAWLFERIKKTKNPNLLMKLYNRSKFGLVKEYWTKVIRLIQSELA